MSGKYDHMLEGWGIERNPFPPEGISQGNEPFDPDLFPEYEQFYQKLIYGAIMDRRGFNFLWSKGVNGEDTGFGKTVLLRQGARQINRDFGETVLRTAGMKPERVQNNHAIAAYASLNTMNVTGIYPVLFGAVEYLADAKNGEGGRSIFGQLRQRICEINKLEEDDEVGVRQAIMLARRKLGSTLSPLPEDAMVAFISPDEGSISEALGEVSEPRRVRSGLTYFDFAITVAEAAGISNFFVLVDQLEDLATATTVSKSKRTREVGRFRDIIAETAPFAGRVRFIFTFHIRAAHALDEMWRLNRLPSYDPEDPANDGSVVVLRGVQTDAQVRELLVTYLDSERTSGDEKSLSPFDEDILPVLRERSAGRAGILLQQAYKVFDLAADQRLPKIDRRFAIETLGNAAGSIGGPRRPGSTPEPTDARAIDELLR